MRIISGSSKGKRILEPEDHNTRPLKDLTKESIFNILIHSNKLDISLQNSNVLDLFSGVGSFGLECLSRGAGHVTFVENYVNVLEVLKKNILNLKYQESSMVLEKDIIENLDFMSVKKKFEIIFLDPPYKERRLTSILNNIIKFNILNNDGVIIIHRHKKERDEFPEKLKIIEEKNYGISKIIFGKYSK